MGVDHRGSHIAVAKHLLNLAAVVVRLQQMRCERVPKCVRRTRLEFPPLQAAALIARWISVSCTW